MVIKYESIHFFFKFASINEKRKKTTKINYKLQIKYLKARKRKNKFYSKERYLHVGVYIVFNFLTNLLFMIEVKIEIQKSAIKTFH